MFQTWHGHGHDHGILQRLVSNEFMDCWVHCHWKADNFPLTTDCTDFQTSWNWNQNWNLQVVNSARLMFAELKTWYIKAFDWTAVSDSEAKAMNQTLSACQLATAWLSLGLVLHLVSNAWLEPSKRTVAECQRVTDPGKPIRRATVKLLQNWNIWMKVQQYCCVCVYLIWDQCLAWVVLQ